MIAPGIITAVINALVSGTPGAWDLADVTTLAGPAKADPLAASASAAILLAPRGKSLRDDLKKIFGGPKRITVELFADKNAFLARRGALTDTTPKPSDGEGVKGFTFLQVPGGASPAEDEAEVLSRANFFVLARLPVDRRTLIVKNVEDWVITSEPFRRMRLAVTIYHELLHVWWARKRVNAREDLAFGNPGEQPYLYQNTGHHDDTAFDINPTTLALETSGTIAPEFRRMLSGFVTELVEKTKLKDALDEERRRYR